MSGAVTQAQLRRGLVLLTLHAQYPFSLVEALLTRATATMYVGDPREAARDLAYLEERKFIATETSGFRGTVLRSFKLTAVGVDVVLGVIEDPGVIIGSPA